MDSFFDDEIKIENKETKEQLIRCKEAYAGLMEGKKDDWKETPSFDFLVKAIEKDFGEYPPIALLEEIVKHYNRKKQNLKIREIPSLMHELGLLKMTLDDGSEIDLKQEVNVKTNNKPGVCAWLKKHGHEDDVKNVLFFDKGQFSEEIEAFLEKEGFSYEITEDIHTQTLKKIMRTRLEQQNIFAQRKEELKQKYGDNIPQHEKENLDVMEKYCSLPPEDFATVTVFEMANIKLPE